MTFLLSIHLAPLFSIFLPKVVTKMYQTMPSAQKAAGWAVLVEEDSNNKELYTAEGMQPPELVGMQEALEHLTYKDFPSLDEHNNGSTPLNHKFCLF
jgi:hypothetical protein